MNNLNYSLEKIELESKYFQTLLSSKFGNGANAQSVELKFNELKKEHPFNSIFCDVSFKKIIFIPPENLQCFINKIELRIIEQSRIIYKTSQEKKRFLYECKDKLKEVFKYEKKFQEFISNFFTKELHTRTCYFCNIHYVNEYNTEDKDINNKNEFTLDHYYDKGSYPYLALSLYNLIPSCYTCNSKLKNTQKIPSSPPNAKNFNFNQKVKFKVHLSSSCKNLHITSKDDIEIPLREYYSNEYEKYIEIFKLNERYKAHKDIVFEMLEKAELYPESRLRELESLTGIPFRQIKKDIFNLIDENEDLSKKPFSKLIKDISEELELI